MSTITDLTSDTFDEAVAGPGIAVVDFWAPWCGPCHMMAPQLERAARLRPQYRFAKVSVDEQPDLAAAFHVQSIPTLAVLRDGQRLGSAAGVVGANQLVEALDKVAAGDAGHRELHTAST
jgi:thioredoxin